LISLKAVAGIFDVVFIEKSSMECEGANQENGIWPPIFNYSLLRLLYCMLSELIGGCEFRYFYSPSAGILTLKIVARGPNRVN
jgi:hypothetical protein